MRENENIRVRTIDVDSGEIKEYSSLFHCGKEYCVCGATVKYWITHGTIRDGQRFESIDYADINGSAQFKEDNKKRACIVEDINGNVISNFNSIKQVAKAYGVTQSSIRNRIFTGKSYGGLIFKLADKSKKIQIPKSCTKKVDYKRNTDLDREKYTILGYKTINHICITPCPYSQHPKPMVGSGRCISCSSFRGRSVETKEIACNRKYV